jgi:hypothetical protein
MRPIVQRSLGARLSIGAIAAITLGACGDVLGIPEVTRLPPDAGVDGAPSTCRVGEKPCASGCASLASPATGCADLSTCDPCSFPHATPICSDTGCAMGQCELGFLHCSDVPTDGCEVNANTDTANCGACGVDCGSGSCSQGTCVCADGSQCGPGVGCSHGGCAG